MYRPSPEEVLRGAMTNETEMVYYAKEMRYPKNGGYKNFLTALAHEVPICYTKKVTLIDTKNKRLELENGEVYPYEILLSTLSLIDIAEMLKDAPSWLLDEAQKLAYTKVVIVSMGFSRPDVMKNLWWYVYDEDIYSPRVHSPGLKSPANVPVGCGSLQFEYHIHNRREHVLPADAYIENTLYGLKKMDIAGKNDPLFIDVRVLPFGNVIFTHETTTAVQKIREYLKSIGIITAGRFGEWGYLWSHQSFMSGWKAAANLLLS
jgi:protoporphyrinogen oxidase